MFLNKINNNLPVQNTEINIIKGYLISSNLIMKILLQCHWQNYSGITLHLGAFTAHSAS